MTTSTATPDQASSPAPTGPGGSPPGSAGPVGRLRNRIADARESIKQWKGDDGEYRTPLPNRSTVEAMPPYVTSAFRDLGLAFGELDFAAVESLEDKRLVLAAGDFCQKLTALVISCREAIQRGQRPPALGTEPFWTAWESIAQAEKPLTVPWIEPIKLLVDQKVSWRQIAIIHELLDESGRPDPDAAKEAAADPDFKHADDWVPPSHRRAIESVHRKYDEFVERWQNNKAMFQL